MKDFYNNVENLDDEYRKTASRIKSELSTIGSSTPWSRSIILRRISSLEVQILEGLRVPEIVYRKSGDLHKWHKAPEKVTIYVGLDPADACVYSVSLRAMWKIPEDAEIWHYVLPHGILHSWLL